MIWSYSTPIENRLQHRITSNSHNRGLKPNKTHYDMNVFKDLRNLLPLPQLSPQQRHNSSHDTNNVWHDIKLRHLVHNNPSKQPHWQPHALLSQGSETNELNFSSKIIQSLLRIRILTKNKDWVIQDSRSLSGCDKCKFSFILFQD